MNVTQSDNFVNDNGNSDIRTNANPYNLNTEITSDEVLKALKCLKRKKACGPDNVLNKMIIISCQFDVTVYVQLFNMILNTGVYPEAWRDNFIKPIFKGGSCNDPSNYRGIALTSRGVDPGGGGGGDSRPPPPMKIFFFFGGGGKHIVLPPPPPPIPNILPT